MKLEFLYVPTSDLAASLQVYRDVLGFTELWREGDTTVALAQPGSDVQIMLDANDPGAPVTPLFVVDSAKSFHASAPAGLTTIQEPSEIPGGYLAIYRDAGGTTIQIMDQSTD